MKFYLLICVSILLSSVGVLAQEQPTRALITTKGDHTIYYHPNVAYITVTLRHDAPKYRTAVGGVDELVNECSREFTKLKSHDVQVSLPTAERFSGQFGVTKLMVVEIRDLATLPKYVEFLDRRFFKHTINLTHDDLDRFDRDVQKEALKKARNDAFQLAEVSGARLGSTFQIDSSIRRGRPKQYIFKPTTPNGPQFEAGTMSVSSTVVVKFNLVPKNNHSQR